MLIYNNVKILKNKFFYKKFYKLKIFLILYFLNINGKSNIV